MAIRVPTNSRLRFTQLLRADGVEFFDTVEFPEVPVQTDDLRYTVQDTDRIDLLASRFYGDATLWWVIAVANELEDMPTDLNPGEVLRIPAPRYVLQTLFEQALT